MKLKFYDFIKSKSIFVVFRGRCALRLGLCKLNYRQFSSYERRKASQRVEGAFPPRICIVDAGWTVGCRQKGDGKGFLGRRPGRFRQRGLKASERDGASEPAPTKTKRENQLEGMSRLQSHRIMRPPWREVIGLRTEQPLIPLVATAAVIPNCYRPILVPSTSYITGLNFPLFLRYANFPEPRSARFSRISSGPAFFAGPRSRNRNSAPVPSRVLALSAPEPGPEIRHFWLRRAGARISSARMAPALTPGRMAPFAAVPEPLQSIHEFL